MSIDARISSVRRRDGHIWLRLAPIQASDGVMSIPGVRTLVIHKWTRAPVAGQQIWGNAAGCIVEAGNGGERIMYERHGRTLVEVTP